MSKKIEFEENDMQRILDCYLNKNESTLHIANKYGVTRNIIVRILKENNIKIRDNNIYKSKTVNENFFKTIDTEEKAYILGFIYADGCVSNGTLEIKLAMQDFELLEKIKLSLSSEHRIGRYINTTGYGIGREYCRLGMTNEKLVNDLYALGVVPNKTKTLMFPTRSQVPPDMVRHFIRGYFDGDGSIHGSYNTPTVSFTGTYNMLFNIQKEFKRICKTKANIRKYKDKDIYDFKVGGRKKVQKIYEYFYENSNIFLRRKNDKFKEILFQSSNRMNKRI